jgi:trans-aconitate methyltransferase
MPRPAICRSIIRSRAAAKSGKCHLLGQRNERSANMSHQRIVDLYEENAAQWTEVRRELTPQERPYLDAFADALPPGGSVLDIGCGSGVPVASFLIDRGFDVTGVDSSPSLIATCRERLPAGTWQAADMRQLDLRRRFDGLIAWHSFFHLSPDDQRAMFPIFVRHAGPGAMLTYTSGPMAGVSMGEWQGEPLYHASLAQEEYRALLADNGFEVLRFTAGEPLAPGPTVWLARYSP